MYILKLLPWLHFITKFLYLFDFNASDGGLWIFAYSEYLGYEHWLIREF